MATYRQNQDFLNTVFDSALSSTIAWIASNLEPEEVFSESDLKAWASKQNPEDIFQESELADWAERNNYTRE